jgi:hypothetical protein
MPRFRPARRGDYGKDYVIGGVNAETMIGRLHPK